MKDQSNAWTEKRIAALEKRIEAVFRKARDDLQKSVNAYFAGFTARDNKMKKRLAAGEITQREYRRWLRGQITQGARWKALRDKVAGRMTDAREVAIAYANDETPGIYSLNRNYAAFTIEGYSEQVDFTLWDERTVRNLILNEPNLMPYYPPPLAVERGIDLAYGRRVITDVITSAALRGSSIPKIAKELMDKIPDMSQKSATRAARTAMGSAQNAGRMDAAAQAEKMGLTMEKWWIATLDNRTRDSHQAMDGEHVPVDKPFSNGLMFPKDPSGPPSEIYNCRCTMAAMPKGIDPLSGNRRAKDPATGKSETVRGMTYKQWAVQKRAENKTAWVEHSGKRPLRERIEQALSE